VHAIDGNVAILRVLKHAALQLREPDLKPQLVILVVLNTLWPTLSQLTVEIAEVEAAEEVEATCCTDYGIES
jgi:hypothetical protein